MKTGFLTVEYEDGLAESFKGLTLKVDDTKIEFNTGNPLIDWYDYYKFVYNGEMAKLGIDYNNHSSSVDHWFMDTDDYCEKYIEFDENDEVRFVDTDLMSFPDLDQCMKCVISNTMTSFADLKNYYNRYKKLNRLYETV